MNTFTLPLLHPVSHGQGTRHTGSLRTDLIITYIRPWYQDIIPLPALLEALIHSLELVENTALTSHDINSLIDH